MSARWWWFWRRASLAGHRVVVYTRAHCHLCEEAGEFLKREQGRLGFGLEFVDVDGNDQLRAKHGECVPVVEVNGQIRFRGSINRVLWTRLVSALTRSGAPS
jgi:glutaredoxin